MDSLVIVIIIAVIALFSIFLIFGCLAMNHQRKRVISQSTNVDAAYPKYQIPSVQTNSMMIQPNGMNQQPIMNYPAYPVQFQKSMNTQNIQMPIPCPIIVPPLIYPCRNVNPMRGQIILTPIIVPPFFGPTLRF